MQSHLRSLTGRDGESLALEAAGLRWASRALSAHYEKFTRKKRGRPQPTPHRPVHTALRFSLNAASPSRASSVIASSAIWLSV